MSSRQEKEKGVNVQVLLRCRPFSSDELRTNAPQVVTCNEPQREVAVSQSIAGKHIDRVFTFDKVFGPSARQKDLYDQAIVPIVSEVLDGFNCTIFAYGQTGTGKTYTMEGDCKGAKSAVKCDLPRGAGVIPRAIKQIFDTLEGQNAEYSVKVTFLELYNEEITDLLAPEELSKITLEDKQKKQLPLMEDGKGGVLVRGLEEEIVTSASEIFTLLERGSAKRRTAETLLNKQSSRSHSLFSITIHIKEATPEGEELIKCGKLNLVDLAGSENISRSGAREGRAREAGEINKSLLTLGRVINALVEHLGHIPYRDSKLTRLLRDSLGGRTKTCIIATVSPAVHCLEETLSTLDYAHRAKHIRNKPEVNQKMMKTTLIKDLYSEIERLKSEVYAAREKNGVYIPKDRYIQEMNEKKAMTDQIEQMGVNIEGLQKKVEELQSKYDDEVQQSSHLCNQLDSTENDLKLTRNMLLGSEKELKKCQYAMKEKDFIISKQRKAEDALTQEACSLRSQLEKAVHDSASLHTKIDREDRLNVENKLVVNNYQEELTKRLDLLCRTVAVSMSRQDEHLLSVDKLCHSLIDGHSKDVIELKKKMLALRALYVSHVDALLNVVRLQKAGSDASLEEVSSSVSASAHSIEEFLTVEGGEATRIHDDLQATLSNQQGELASFARELQKRFKDNAEHLKDISELINGYLLNITDEVGKLGAHAAQMKKLKMNSICELQKDFEEQSKSDAEKLLADMTILVNSHIRHQKEMVESRLDNLREDTLADRAFLDGHISSMEVITTDAKRKWQAFSKQAESDANDGAEFSAAKHCRMESLMQLCVGNIETASNHVKKTHQSLSKMSDGHLSSVVSLIRNAMDSNEHHIAEVDSARATATQDAVTSSDDILQHLESLSAQQQGVVSGIMTVAKTQSEDLDGFQKDHSSQASSIKEEAEETFHRRYMEYEATGVTPVRSEPDIPSKATIESLRAMPMDALAEEFRENNPCESVDEKQIKPSLIPRSPFAQVN